MYFNSIEYALFLPLAAAVFWGILLLKRFVFLQKNQNGGGGGEGFAVFAHRLSIWWLIAVSYFFYSCWDWRLSALILISTIVNYIAGERIAQTPERHIQKRWLLLCLVLNFGFLGFFKYCNFFLLNFKALTDFLGFHLPIEALHIILPVGISFYTFQTLSYVLDIYGGKIKPTGDFAKFALFVAFFPQLVAGPIVRAADFLPQLDTAPKYDDKEALEGFYQILSGLMKKIMIADILAATLVDPAFKNPEQFSGLWLLLTAYGYGLQIYCDFSAYSDIAIGSARILGYQLPVNFNRPYSAVSLTDFWKRWHISLSTWLRDYLYIPLGGNRFGTFNTYRNLFITMLLGGLWHGAAWNFVIWGGLHGLWLAVERLLFGKKTLLTLEGQSKPFIFFRWLLTFHVIISCLVFFRANPTETLSSLGVVETFFSRIVHWSSGESGFSWWFIGVLIFGYAMHFTPPHWKTVCMERFVRTNVFIQTAIAVVLLMIYTLFNTGSSAFIYFQF